MVKADLFSDHGNAKTELKIMYDIQKSARTPEEKKRVIADMIALGKKNGFSFSEYMIYDFEHKSPEEQHAFISDKEHFPLCDQLNSPEIGELFDSKIGTFRKFGKYFGREMYYVTDDTSGGFPAFAEAHPALFIKPDDDWGGNNARKADLADYPDAKVLLRELLEQYPHGFLAEERLSNAEPFLSLHPGSLNTVRLPAVKIAGQVKIVHPFVRIGRGSAIVDNAASGGIMGLVDVETGVITAARDESGTYYTVHPDTGVRVVGFQIPEWEKAKKLACELTCIMDAMHYCGWDLAYTPKGWVMIEGNSHGQFVWQMVDGIGCRDEFEGYVKMVAGEK